MEPTLIRIETPEHAAECADIILGMVDDLVAVDIETAALPDALGFRKAALYPVSSTIRLAQFCSDRDTRSFVFEVWKTGIEPIRKIIEGRVLYSHNATFEQMFFEHNGIKPKKLHCTLLMRKVLSEGKVSLADTVKDVLGVEMDKSMQNSGWHAKELTDAQWQYAAYDAFYGCRIVEPLINQLKALPYGIEAYSFYAKAVPVIARIQLRGVPFDAKSHEAMAAQWQTDAETAKAKAESLMGGINAASTKEVAAWVTENVDEDTLAKWPKTEKTQQLQITADVIQGVADKHPALAAFAKWKLDQKMDSTYGRGIAKDVNPKSGRLHPSYMILGARTGRFTSNSPNFQNWPREGGMRELVVAPEGWVFLDPDYSQIELRIMAVYSGDPTMLEAYKNGVDLHTITATAMTGKPADQITKEDRQAAKAINFGLLYGAGPTTLMTTAKTSYGVVMTEQEARDAKAKFLETYPRVAQWQRETSANASERMRSNTAMGLTRDYVKEGESYNSVYTKSLNTPIQGTGAEILTEAMVRADEAFTREGLDAHITAHIHDQILVLVREEHKHQAARLIEKAMVEGAEHVLKGIPTRGLVEMVEGTIWSKKHMKLYSPDSSTSDVSVEEVEADSTNAAVAEAFREYSAMGYSLATMPAGAKHPEGQQGWGNKPAKQLPRGHENLGIIHYWSKTACLDCDDLEKVKKIFEYAKLDFDALTAGVPAWHGNPVNRMKYLFKLPENVEFKSDSLEVFGDIILELRATTIGEQLQDVIPPSRHPDGYTYEWTQPLVPNDELPVMPPALLDFWQAFHNNKPDYQSLFGDNRLLAERYTRGSGQGISDRTRALIDNFNAKHTCTEFLPLGGYIPPQGWGKKWLYPKSRSGTPGVWVSDEDKVVVSHHTGDPLGFRKPHDPFDLFRLFVHNGEFESAKNAALEELGEPEVIEGELVEVTQDDLTRKKTQGPRGQEPDDPFEGMADGLSGFLRRIYDYCMASAYRPVNPFSIAAAFSAFSTLTENHYLIDGYNTRLNVYMILIGRTGLGKESPRVSVKNLLSKVGLGNVLIESAASGIGLKQKLSNNRTLLMMPDEIGTMLAQANGRNGDVHQKGVQKELRTLFSSAGTIYAGHSRADSRRDIPNIENPFVNLLGTSTPIEFLSGIQSDQLENGLVNRLLMIDAPKTPSKRVRNAEQEPPKELVRDLVEFTMRRMQFPTRVLISDAAQALIRESEQLQDDLLMSDSALAMLYGRVNEITMRLAALMAVSDRPEKPVINTNHMRWAIDFVHKAFKLMERKFADNHYENQTERDMKKIVSIIREQPEEWVPRAVITKKSKMQAKHIEEHIRTLKQAEMIEETEVQTDGRPARLYRLAEGM